MIEQNKPKGAEYWCPEHGDDNLQANAIEEQHVLIDAYGDVHQVKEGWTEFKKVWCGECEKVLNDFVQDKRPVYQLLESDIQSHAEDGYGRRLDEDELSRVIKGLEYALGEHSADVIGEIVSGIMARTGTEPIE